MMENVLRATTSATTLSQALSAIAAETVRMSQSTMTNVSRKQHLTKFTSGVETVISAL